MLEHLGYKMLRNSGSRRKFYHSEKQALIICHEPHPSPSPSPSVDKVCVADVVEHLRVNGLFDLNSMDLLQYKGYEGTAELDMARRVCRSRVLFIDDVVTYEALTPDLLQQEFEAAVVDYLETCAQVGKEPQRPFKGLLNVRVPPALHRAAVVRAASDGVALNEVVVQALAAHLHIRPEVSHLAKDTSKNNLNTLSINQSGFGLMQ